MFRLIILGIPLLTLAWWWWADRRLREIGDLVGIRIGMAVVMLAIMIGYVWVLSGRRDILTLPIPAPLYALILIWGILCLPLIALPSAAGWSVWKISRRLVFKTPEKPPVPTAGWNRRKWLGAAALTLPVWTAFAATLTGLLEMTHFRIRRIIVTIPDLPPALDGLRIAHVTDTHIGKFTRGDVLQHIASATTGLRADLVVFTGDLIDNSMRDLPQAIAMLQSIQPRAGLFVIEGNHDLFDEPELFRSDLRSAAGLTFLRNEAATVSIRGVPVQLIGIPWSDSDPEIARDVAAAAALRDPAAFPILLAHHPHAFDPAREWKFPLTLAGHTHGGQLMLTKNIGGGPMLFRYWTGLYKRPAGSLVVSNGTGNWFPLRVNAPAEILDLTLRRA